jgi:hypothetical protein
MYKKGRKSMSEKIQRMVVTKDDLQGLQEYQHVALEVKQGILNDYSSIESGLKKALAGLTTTVAKYFGLGTEASFVTALADFFYGGLKSELTSTSERALSQGIDAINDVYDAMGTNFDEADVEFSMFSAYDSEIGENVWYVNGYSDNIADAYNLYRLHPIGGTGWIDATK